MKTKFEKKYTDQELCLLIQQKNKAGFDKLYDQYSYMVYGLASKTIRSKECAEEIAELTFLNIWNSIHVFQNQKKNLCLWIVSILITTAKDYLESKNIKYIINTDNFPDFAFDILEEEAC